MIIPPPREDFVVGIDDLNDVQVCPPEENSSFCWFYHAKRKHLIKHFTLAEQPQVVVRCEVTLIAKDGKFTPRFKFSKRKRNMLNEVLTTDLERTEENLSVKAAVDLNDCYKNFWELLSYFLQMRELDIPTEKFSMVSKTDLDVIKAVRQQGPDSIKQIVKAISEGVPFTEADVNELLQRKKRLAEFKVSLERQIAEDVWQKFFEDNKWIFGYGLNYVILRLERPQAHVVGATVEGTGAQKTDFLASSGPSKFTVLVEIKTPQTPLLRGKDPIRSGAWSLNTELTDALAQINANVEGWGSEGQNSISNRQFMTERNLPHTVKPKGIIVIGTLRSINQDQTKLNTFELFRKSIHGVEILTFDELYDRARYIVERV